MDYYQAVVMEYIRANRANFVNPECLVTLGGNPNSPPKGKHWYVDAVVLNLQETTAYLCEVSFSVHLSALRGRLASWAANWTGICTALERDAGISSGWTVRPWLFAPSKAIKGHLLDKLPAALVTPKITPLEMTAPWEYPGWHHPKEHAKPDWLPKDFW